MERLVLDQLKTWKNKKNRKPLLVTGVRQCGKTYTIKEFGEKWVLKASFGGQKLMQRSTLSPIMKAFYSL